MAELTTPQAGQIVGQATIGGDWRLPAKAEPDIAVQELEPRQRHIKDGRRRRGNGLTITRVLLYTGFLVDIRLCPLDGYLLTRPRTRIVTALT